MFKKLLAVALAILATLMIVSCQQSNNAPTENVDPNMPEKIYKNPEMYITLKNGIANQSRRNGFLPNYR